MARTPGTTHDIRGHRRMALIRDIAANDESMAQLAAKYNRHPQAIYQFTARNRAEIDEARREMGSEFTGLWIARKESRIAEYQQKYEDLDTLLGDLASAIEELLYLREDPESTEEQRREAAEKLEAHLADHPDINRYVQTQLKIMASVAEEMGHLPSRTPGEGPSPVVLRHEVVGIDMATAMFDPRFDELPDRMTPDRMTTIDESRPV